MNDKEQKRFDAWWRENRTRLITIYNEELELGMAIMEIAEMAWRGAVNANKDSNIN